MSERQWCVGEVLGSEAALLERYGVSRAVFREAVRLVEHQGVARMRRGPGGGLVITEPTAQSVSGALFAYLYRVSPTLDELFEARIVIEGVVAELAPSRLNQRGVAALRAIIADEAAGRVVDHRSLHNRLAAVARNPVLSLFVEALNQATALYVPGPRLLGREVKAASAYAHKRVVDAVLARDPSLAGRRMRQHLQAEADWLRRKRPARRLPNPLAFGAPGASKRAEAVAGTIFSDVLEHQREIGDLLGSESELMERHDVSRAVLREAVRLVEHHQIAAMRRGPGGGLFVTAPSTEAISGAVALYLERNGIDRRNVIEVRSSVEVAQVRLAIRRMDHTGSTALRAALAAEKVTPGDEIPDVGHDVHRVIASLARNRVLELLALVCIQLTLLHQHNSVEPQIVQRARDQVVRAHGRIGQAMLDSDVELATRRMRKHVEALQRYLR